MSAAAACTAAAHLLREVPASIWVRVRVRVRVRVSVSVRVWVWVRVA